jgi:hypothetical protein
MRNNNKSSLFRMEEEPKKDPELTLSLEEDTAPVKSAPVHKTTTEILEEEHVTKQNKVPLDLPVCVYGPECTRKNEQHFAEFSHPKPNKELKRKADLIDNEDHEVSEKKVKKTTDIDEVMERALAKAMEVAKKEVELMKKEMQELKKELQNSKEKTNIESEDQSGTDSPVKVGNSNSKAKSCKYGAQCTRKNPQHFQGMI